MSADRLITLAIHTYDKAIALKSILEREGIVAVLNNVNLSKPAISSGVRVRIPEKDLPLALRIVENPDIFNWDSQFNDTKPTIVVPVDFSDYSYRACLIAFNLAKQYKARIDILYSYIQTHPIERFKNFNNEEDSANSGFFDAEQEAQVQIEQFSKRIIEQIKFGLIPPIKFSTKVLEGVPEDVINDYTKTIKPLVIVMGTRGSGKKEKELIGSVTGEVLDICRFPVLAIPESANIFEFEGLKHVVFFCNNEHEDIVALDTMYRLLPNTSLNVTIVNIPPKIQTVVDSFVSSEQDLIRYCSENYPRFNFSLKKVNLSFIIDDFRNIGRENPIDLIVLPNKKRNVFSRFFNPSLAHKLLLHADIPMMTIPI